MTGADHTAIKDGEEVFSGVGVLKAAMGDKMPGRVVHALVVAISLAARLSAVSRSSRGASRKKSKTKDER